MITSSFSQEQFHHFQKRNLKCFSREFIQELESVDQILIQNHLKSSLEDLDNQIQLETEKSVSKVLKQHRRVVQKLLKLTDSKTGLIDILPGVCRTLKQGIGNFSRFLGEANTYLSQIALFPAKLAWFTARGMFGKPYQATSKNAYYYVGKNYLRSVNTTLLLYSLKNLAPATNLTLLPFFASSMGDLYANTVCMNQNLFNQKEIDFCNKYFEIKMGFNEFYQKASQFGYNLFRRKKEELEQEIPNFLEMNNQQICEIRDLLNKNRNRFDLRLVGEQYALLMTPENLSQLQVDTLYENRSINMNQFSSKRNIIITLADGKTLGEDEIDKLREEHKLQNKEVSRYQRIIVRALKKNSTEKCVEQLDNNGFDASRLKSLVDKKREIPKDLETAMEENLISSVLRRTIKPFNPLKRLKLNWEVIAANSVEKIHQLLNSPEVQNVILIAHASSNGNIVDHYGRYLPKNFFSQVSSNIQSIGIFSCHSDKVIENYKLRRSLSRTHANLPIRHVFSLKNNEHYLNIDKAPLHGVGSFLKRVDRVLFDGQKENLLRGTLHQESSDQSDTEICNIHFQNFSPNSPIAVNINGILVGYLNKQNNRADFQCQILNNENQLRLLKVKPDDLLPEIDSKLHFEIGHRQHRVLQLATPRNDQDLIKQIIVNFEITQL